MTTKITCLADILAHTPRVRVIKENDENELVEELKRRGVVTSGNIINQY